MLVETEERGGVMNGMILVGVDGTSACHAAISWAVRRAVSLDSTSCSYMWSTTSGA